MKEKIKIIVLIVLLKISLASAQVGIGTNTPEPSAALDVTSTSQGFLLPRLTNAQKLAIESPVAGLEIWCIDSGLYGEAQVYNGFTWTNMIGDPVSSVATVTNPTTGKTWMNTNLGTSQVANSSTDTNSYGDLYQWGRNTDGHQYRTSGNTVTLSSSDVPGNSNFILNLNAPYDWRITQNNNLWQGVDGTNNPCPSGYRLPTETEWNEERLTWSSNNAAGAFNSSLKLTMAGYRYRTNGSISSTATNGYYLTSTVAGSSVRLLQFTSNSAIITTGYRANGFSVRCIRNY